jgi:hypothetical protein
LLHELAIVDEPEARCLDFPDHGFFVGAYMLEYARAALAFDALEFNDYK